MILFMFKVTRSDNRIFKLYLSFANTDIPCSNIGTTVWSRYARVGKDCRSTLERFVGVSMASFSLDIIF